MNIKIITISREFGSGGRTIGKKLAEDLGIPCYDKEIIEKIADTTKLDKRFIEEQGEYAPSRNAFAYAFVGRNVGGMSLSDYLWSKQREKILEIAEKESCVIVGRCADYILRDRDDVLNVFIHASEEFKEKRIVEVYGETDKSPKKRLSEKDKKRSVNYSYYTDQVWGKAQNYHVTLDSGKLGIERCAGILAGIVKK